MFSLVLKLIIARHIILFKTQRPSCCSVEIHAHVYCNSICNSLVWNQPSYGWMDKESVVQHPWIHTSTQRQTNTILLCLEEKKIIICKKIEGTRDHRSKQNKPTPDKYYVLSLSSETYRLEKNRGWREEWMCLKNIIQKCQEDIHYFLQEMYAKIKNGTAHGRNNAKLALIFNLKLKVLPNVLIIHVCYTICKCYYWFLFLL